MQWSSRRKEAWPYATSLWQHLRIMSGEHKVWDLLADTTALIFLFQLTWKTLKLHKSIADAIKLAVLYFLCVILDARIVQLVIVILRLLEFILVAGTVLRAKHIRSLDITEVKFADEGRCVLTLAMKVVDHWHVPAKNVAVQPFHQWTSLVLRKLFDFKFCLNNFSLNGACQDENCGYDKQDLVKRWLLCSEGLE